MLYTVINIIHVFFLVYLIRRYIKKRIDTSLIWFYICSLFFISVPLLFDSFMILFEGDKAQTIKAAVNENWISNAYNNMTKVSVYALIFDLCVYIMYVLVNRKFKLLKFGSIADVKNDFFGWPIIIVVSYGMLALFMINFGITSVESMDVNWSDNWSYNKWLNLLTNLILSVAPVGILKGLWEKKYLYILIILIPFAIVGFITGARAFIITVVFIVIYYYVWKKTYTGFSMGSLFLFGIIGYVAFVFLTYSREHQLFIYPLSLDRSYSDLFYCFANADKISTNGVNFLRMISTGFLQFDDGGVGSVEEVVANMRYFDGWGTLHPTILGWAYLDMVDLFFIPALFFGLFLGLFDFLRSKMSIKIGLLFLCIILRFCPIAVRGSVQYAYSTAIYPIIIFVAYLIFSSIASPRKRKHKQNGYNIHS